MKQAILIACVCVGATAFGATALGPSATLKEKNGQVNRLLKIKPPKGSAAEKKQKDDIKALASTLLDYGELTKRAMADHWDKITSAQQTDLVTTLKELIERNYVKQLRSNIDYKVLYKEENIDGDEATVHSVVKVKTKGRDTDADIVYKLRKVDAGWVVWDVVTDEVSLMRNYKSQFNRIITDNGFPELLKRMKDKLKQDDDQNAKDKAAKSGTKTADAKTGAGGK
ncbi:MAG: phospholipid-binding protein MlaC [Polyangia bacterium]